MKYKQISKEQLIISIDRLTRFKPTFEKYFRVFSYLVISNLIEPKLKKTDLIQLEPEKLCFIAQTIINSYFETHSKTDYSINKVLKNYENDLFTNNPYTKILLRNTINYDSIVNLLNKEKDLPINLKWLCALKENSSLDELRETHNLRFPIKKLIIVEGITEEILIPKFSKLCGYDFDKNGIQILSAGGKNQVVKMFYHYVDILKAPIFTLLDADATENAQQIKNKLREIDKIHLVSCGEFEDLLPLSLIIKTLNAGFKNFSSVTKNDFHKNLPMVEQLETLFKEKGTSEFKKAGFAKSVSEQLSCKSDISPEIKKIIEEISEENSPVIK